MKATNSTEVDQFIKE